MKKALVYSIIFRWDDRVPVAIESVLNQTHPEFEFHILTSSESSLPLQNYAKEDGRIVLHQHDAGNFDLNQYLALLSKLVQGVDYFTAFDGDDRLDTQFLETQIGFCEENNLDISCCSVDVLNTKSELIEHRFFSKKMSILESSKFVEFFPYYITILGPLWGKVFKTSLFYKGMWDGFPRNDTYGAYGGDTRIALELLKGASRVGFHTKVGYYYQIWDQGITLKFSKGREHCPAFYLAMLLDFHKHFGEEIPYKSEHYIRVMHLGLLIETLRLVHYTNFSKKEKIEKIPVILTHQEVAQSVRFIQSSDLDDLNTEKELKHAFSTLMQSTWTFGPNQINEDELFSAFLILYPEYAALQENELLKLALEDMAVFKALTDANHKHDLDEILFSIWKQKKRPAYAKLAALFSEKLLFKFMVDTSPSEGLLKKHPKLLRFLFLEDAENTIVYIDKKLSENDENSLFLIEILIKLAAVAQAQDLFVQAMAIKANLLKAAGDEKGYFQVQGDLAEMGFTMQE